MLCILRQQACSCGWWSARPRGSADVGNLTSSRIFQDYIHYMYIYIRCMYYFISHVDTLLLGSQLWPIKSRWILVPTFDLLKVVLLRQIHSQLPLIQKDTPWTRKSSDFGAWRAHLASKLQMILQEKLQIFYRKSNIEVSCWDSSLPPILGKQKLYCGKPNDNHPQNHIYLFLWRICLPSPW